jgi:hypothetical protein
MSTSTPTLQERRRRERFATSDLEATCAGGHLQVRNVSLNGLSFETESRLTPGSVVPLKLVSAAGELQLKARVIWCRMVGNAPAADGNRPCYRGGVRFEAVGERAGEMLVELVAGLWKKRRT